MPSSNGGAMLATVVRLRQIVADGAGGQIAPDDGRWLADVLGTYLATAQDGLALEEVLGIAPMPGAAPWWAVEARERRDTALRALAGQLHPDTPMADRVEEVRRQLSRYAIRWQREDCRRSAPPAHYAGTAHEHLFAAMRATDGKVPMSPKRLRAILASI